jgi:hypothetical protein
MEVIPAQIDELYSPGAADFGGLVTGTMNCPDTNKNLSLPGAYTTAMSVN